MRHTFREQCPGSGKAHIWRLPDLEVHEVVPSLSNPSKRGIVIIPIFEGRKVLDNHTYDAHSIGGVWARRSWMANSDASDYGIDVKFYIEDRVLDYVLPVLRQNHVADNDIIVFDGTPYEGVHKDENGWVSYIGKKISFMSDEVFKDYEWVFECDTDLFVMRGNRPLPFFKNFFEGSPSDMIGVLNIHRINKTPVDLDWCYDAYRNRTDEAVKAWKDRVGSLFGHEIVERYFNTDHYQKAAHGCLMAFPAKHFMANRHEDCLFIRKAARVLHHDEAVISLWHEMGNPLYNMKASSESEDTPFIHLSSNLATNSLEAFNKLAGEDTPFLLHYGGVVFEKTWRQGIGAL